MTVKITNVFIRKIAGEKPDKVREFRDAKLRGFLVRQQTSGYISYYAATTRGSARRGNRRQQKVRIGEHPAIGPTEARKAAEELIAKARLDTLPIEKDRERCLLRHFIDTQYMPWARVNLKDPVSQEGQIRRFSEWDRLYLDEIDKHLVENWRNKRIIAGARPATINRNITVISSILRRAVEWGFLEHHPLTGIKKLKVDQGDPPAVLSVEDHQKLFDGLADRDRKLSEERQSSNRWRAERGYPPLPVLPFYGDHLTPIVMTAYYTGMRRGEIFSLQWDDVDVDNRRVTVKGANTKTSQTRIIPICDVLHIVLSNWRKQNGLTSGFVFPGKHGERLDNINTSWGKLRREYGLTHLKFKDLRSDFGSRLANNGVDLSVTQRLLGHSSPVVTMRYYVTIKAETLRQAVAAAMV